MKKIRKSQEDYKKYNHQLQKQKKLQERENELSKRRKLIRKQIDSN